MFITRTHSKGLIRYSSFDLNKLCTYLGNSEHIIDENVYFDF